MEGGNGSMDDGAMSESGSMDDGADSENDRPTLTTILTFGQAMRHLLGSSQCRDLPSTMMISTLLKLLVTLPILSSLI